MQGIQVMTTIDDAWGGFASSYIEAIRDEFPKTCIWTWALQSPLLSLPRAQRSLRLANTALSLGQTCSQSSMVLPLSIPEVDSPSDVRLDKTSSWHVSALFATAIETATLPTRLESTNGVSPISFHDLAENLNTSGSQFLATASMRVGSVTRAYCTDFSQINQSKTSSKEHTRRVFGCLRTARGLGWEDDSSDEAGDTKVSDVRHLVDNAIYRK